MLFRILACNSKVTPSFGEGGKCSCTQNQDLFLDLLIGAILRMAGPAWGQKSCYFPFHFSADMLTSPAIFSFVCGLKLSRIFKEKKSTCGRKGVDLEKREEAHLWLYFLRNTNLSLFPLPPLSKGSLLWKHEQDYTLAS